MIFDKIMPIVQVSTKNYEIMDVLLDGDSRVNVILEHLRRKLRLKKPHSIPFMVRMVDQWKVQLVGLIQNLKIKFAGCTFKISIIIS
jgi:hypothetical protein